MGGGSVISLKSSNSGGGGSRGTSSSSVWGYEGLNVCSVKLLPIEDAVGLLGAGSEEGLCSRVGRGPLCFWGV